MTPFVMVKLFRAFLTIWIAVTFVFIILRLSGNPALSALGEDAPLDALHHFNQLVGLDRSIWFQYLTFLKKVTFVDFGTSFRDGRAVSEIVLERLPKTGLLMGTSFVFGAAVGIPAGALAAHFERRWIDRTILSLATASFSLPNFCLGILLTLIFVMKLQIAPGAGSETLGHVFLPALAIGTGYAGILARFTRSALLDIHQEPFILAAESRGLSRLDVLVQHAFPNAAIPVVTIAGLIFGGLVSGAVVIETIFAWPGIGQLLVSSVANRDLPVVQALILLLTVSMVTINTCVDLAYFYLDPRIRAGGER
ncbi:ABC transporter permease [Aliirhizobium smilacinae]|uniref:ABC transporter permease n=1 Tax=Aliirhizobium smilacinae TaxID=1395944 RepID=A0A5C4XP72_9HYPH|nr:ABC transporter permease [Rhizobium smilacinae]TNM65346.1 ABC transporter permease [Rhizobium smilacinae]